MILFGKMTFITAATGVSELLNPVLIRDPRCGKAGLTGIDKLEDRFLPFRGRQSYDLSRRSQAMTTLR
jgi:hypothetical protein